MIKDRCLIIFVKYPERGKVKSRLARHLTGDIAADLSKNFILDIIATAEKGLFGLKIYFYPQQKEKELKELLGENYAYAAQRGENLGERMKNAFLQEFAAGCRQVVLIGSDLPDLPADIIEQAFQYLENQGRQVIGPAADGGYYLIGFQKDSFCPEIFSGVEWGSSSVLEKTMTIFHSGNHSPAILPQWKDIDTREDLDELVDRSTDTPFAHSQTMKFLKNNNFVK